MWSALFTGEKVSFYSILECRLLLFIEAFREIEGRVVDQLFTSNFVKQYE